MKPVYLIGFMGVGKTTLGKKLARMLGYDFVDLDVAFEHKYRLSIRLFFEKYGEALFRQFESELLATTFDLRGVVISTGGGTPCFGDAMEKMNHHGITVYLQMPPAGLVHRLRHAHRQRPLLAGRTEADLLQYIESKLGEREHWYGQAQHIVDAHRPDLEQLKVTIEELNK